MFEILAVNEKYIMDEIPAKKEDELDVMEIKSNTSERAAKCAQMRNFKESVAKEKRKEEMANRIIDGVCGAFLGVFIFSFFMGCLFLACI